jgi:hypothetical protein
MYYQNDIIEFISYEESNELKSKKIEGEKECKWE